MRNQTVCFTGHRQINSDLIFSINEKLEKLIAELISRGYSRFLTGGALGFDTIAQQAVLRARKKNKKIKLIIVQPCSNQDEKWSKSQKKEYNHLLKVADDVICLSENYYNGCMQRRNRYMVDNSNLCIAFFCNMKGGTFYTVNYAQKMNIPVINIAIKD